AEDAVGVELIAVDRIGRRSVMLVGPVDAQAQEEPEERIVRRRGRGPAPVVGVARRAGEAVERRPQPVGALRRGRRRHPVAVEDAVADLERAAVVGREVARRVGERFVAVVEDGGVAAEERLRRIDRQAIVAAERGARGEEEQRSRARRAHRLLTIPSVAAAWSSRPCTGANASIAACTAWYSGVDGSAITA